MTGLERSWIKGDHAKSGGGKPSGKGKGALRGNPVALAASLAEQCRFWVTKKGCYNPDTCSKGRHDPEWKGLKDAGQTTKGVDPAQPIAGAPPNGKGKGKDGKGKKGKSGDGTDGGKGAAAQVNPTAKPTVPAGGKLPADSLVDKQGRRLCYAFVHGKCTEPCPHNRYHGPATQAMHNRRLVDEKKIAVRLARGQTGNQSDVESGNEAATKPAAKPKHPKTKQGTKPKATAE